MVEFVITAGPGLMIEHGLIDIEWIDGLVYSALMEGFDVQMAWVENEQQ